MLTDNEEEEIEPLKRIRKKNHVSVVRKVKTREKDIKNVVFSSTTGGKRSPICEALSSQSTSPKSNSAKHEILFSSCNNKVTSKFISIQIPSLENRKYGPCPVCNIDLNFIHGMSPQMHINMCLDVNPDYKNGYCSGGSTCCLSDEKHFRVYKHSLKPLQSPEEAEINNPSIIVDESVLIVSKNTPKTDNELRVNNTTTNNKVTTESSNLNNLSKATPCKKSENSRKLLQTNISSFFGGEKVAKFVVPSNTPKAFTKDTQPKVLNNAKGKYVSTIKKKGGAAKKECPFYKRIADTGITVDAFRYGDIPGCTSYFLTHFHSDHYGGLTKNFTGKIFCSKITANLVLSQIHVDEKYIVVLPMYKIVLVDGAEVVLLDANHCPGSVMFLIRLNCGRRVLHVGDFRANQSMFDNPYLQPSSIDILYLDTTYCNPKYTFPPQEEVITLVKDLAKRFLNENHKTLIACGTYTVGKERVFKSLALRFHMKIGVSAQKMKVLCSLEDVKLKEMLTLNYNEAQLHVLSLGAFSQKKLSEHLAKYKPKYERLLAFKPTGWTYQSLSLTTIKPTVSGDVVTFGVPYSEHSSFSELEWFVRTLKPKSIIPTVNIGTKQSRDVMNEYFRTWLK